MLRPCAPVTGPQLGVGVCGLGPLLTPLSLTLGPRRRTAGTGSPHRGPDSACLRGDTHHGGGHSLDLPAGRLYNQPPAQLFPGDPFSYLEKDKRSSRSSWPAQHQGRFWRGEGRSWPERNGPVQGWGGVGSCVDRVSERPPALPEGWLYLGPETRASIGPCKAGAETAEVQD